MARIQALRQARFISNLNAPLLDQGGYDEVPKFHPLKSSNPVFKASGLLMKLRNPRVKKLSLKMGKI